MAKPRKKRYETGDHSHFIITDDFTDSANRFFKHCDANMINASGAMRRAMTEWLDRNTPTDLSTTPTRVIEDVFVIYKDGALLAHATSHVIPNLDMEIFSSMLTLIQGFVTDSFTDLKNTGLRMIEFGERTILIEPAKSAEIILALVYSRKIDRAQIENIANSILYEIEFSFGFQLQEFDGNLNKVRGMREIIVNYLYEH